MPSVVTKTSPQDWKYVSEGGATIVFSYVGPQNPELDGMVLRLRKIACNYAHPPETPADHTTFHEAGHTLPEQNNLDEREEPDDPSISFQNRCMSRLIPPTHLPRLESVGLDYDWLETFSTFHNADRPVERSHHDNIDTSRKKGVLATDLVGCSDISVEIKPKWSFLPNTTYLSNSTQPVKARTCRFCMHSSLKSLNGQTVSVKYCPLDLFSADQTRVHAAVESLYDSWFASEGTVNNLKIFVRGKKIAVSERLEMLVNDSKPSDEELKDLFTSSLLPYLTSTPVLYTLNKLQRSLDILDIEGLTRLWEKVYPSTQLGDGPGAKDPSLREWDAFITNYLASSALSEARFKQRDKLPDESNLRHFLLAYLLSTTFKDCSIIIRMDLLDPLRGPITVDPKHVTVIDLDPKSLHRLEKWYQLDAEIVNEYAKVDEGQRKVCFDDWVDVE